MKQRILIIFTLLTLTALLMIGCGTDKSDGSAVPAMRTGQAQMTINWPVATRLIPLATNSIKITISDGQGFSDSQTVNRPVNVPPTSTVTFDELSSGNLNVTATAYPLANAAGVAQATGSATEVIVAGETALLTLTMNSTITQVIVTPSSPVISATGTVQMVANSQDSAGDTVIVANGNISWTSLDPTIATVDSVTGMVTGVKVGTATITAMESESGKSGNTTVTVLGITPKLANIFATTTQQFTANVPNANIIWSVIGGNVNGTITSTGLYTAPLAAGIYVVKATSTVDALVSDTATVTVTHLGPAPIELGGSGNFAILAGSTVTNTGATIINGDLGVSPGTAVVGFLPGIVNGSILVSPDAIVAQAKLDITTAYLDAVSRSTDVVNIPTGELGGLTLAPGLYKSGISSFGITSVDLTLDAQGDPSAVWVFQMPSSTFTVGNGRKVTLAGGAQAKNIYWQVGSSATLGTTCVVEGNILAQASITLQTGATLNGRALTQTAAVSLDANTVTKP